MSNANSRDVDVAYLAVRPCLLKDLGRQRCRLPIHLISTLKVSIGSYVSIKYHNHQLICSVHPWKDQLASIFQADETVKLGNSSSDNTLEFNKLSETLQHDCFKKMKVESIKQLDVSLVFMSYKHLRQFNDDRKSWILLIGDVLSGFAIVSGCVIDCRHSPPSKLLGLQLIIVKHCKLAENSVGFVSSKTSVTVVEALTNARYSAVYQEQPNALLGGLEKQRQLLEDVIGLTNSFNGRTELNRAGARCPKGVLMIGPAGTGKTSLVRSVARQCKAAMVEVSAPSICRSFPGETGRLLREIFEEAVSASQEGVCLLFIDELDSLFSNGETAGHQRLLVTQMISLMDEAARLYPNLIIVGATNQSDLLDAGLRRPGRFDYEVCFGIPTLIERADIIRKLTEKLNVEKLNVERLAEMTHGYVGADLQLLCQEVVMAKISSSRDEVILFDDLDFERALKLVLPSTQRSAFASVDLKAVTWDEIGGLEDTKLQLKQSVEWPMRHAAAFQRLGISWPKGILLYGPPGCCKTTLVRAVATACSASFFSASAAHIYSPLVGDSEKTISEIFHQARTNAPSIIFLDEIDSVVGKRSGDAHRSVHEKVLSTLLNEMDGIGVKVEAKRSTDSQRDGEVIVIAATNRPDLLDEAILRPGRFDRIIYVPSPDEAGREQILKIVTSKMPVVDFDVKRFAKQTANFTGADLENLCREAALHALSSEGIDVVSVENKHFEQVLKTMRPTLTEQQIASFNSQYSKFEAAK